MGSCIDDKSTLHELAPTLAHDLDSLHTTLIGGNHSGGQYPDKGGRPRFLKRLVEGQRGGENVDSAVQGGMVLSAQFGNALTHRAGRKRVSPVPAHLGPQHRARLHHACAQAPAGQERSRLDSCDGRPHDDHITTPEDRGVCFNKSYSCHRFPT